MLRNIRRFLEDRSGQTAVEYGLLAGLIAIALAAGAASAGNGVGSVFNRAGNEIANANH